MSLKNYEFWFVVGSQDLYGEEVLKTVAERAAEMAAKMSESLPQHIPVNGIAVQNTRSGHGIGDEFGAVVGQNRTSAGNTGKYTLPSSGEAGKKVRFDKALGNQQIRFVCNGVDLAVTAGGQLAEID